MNTERATSLALRVAAVSLAMAALVGRDSSARALPAPTGPVVAAVPNLMAYWPFDETAPGTAQDFSGNLNDGTPINGPTISTSIPPMTHHGAGANQRSLDFVQSSSQVVEAMSSPTLALTGSFTISAWVYPKSGSSNQRGIVTKWDGSTSTGGYDMRLEATRYFAMGVFDGTPGMDSRSTAPNAVNEGAWTHVAATYDSTGGILKLYVNGVEHGTVGTGIAPPTASGATLQIGEAQGAQFFHGNIDEVRIYNRALLDTEIPVLQNGQEPPSGLAAAGQAGQVHLTWNAPVGGSPTTYSVFRGPSAGTYDTVFNAIPGANTSYDDTTATPGTPYHYVVVAVSVVASDPSNSSSAAASAVVPPGPPPPPRTEKVGDRHMCGCDTVSSTSGWAGVLAMLLLLVALRRR
jgi:MYXO-CTERM domain-containing protein